MGVIGSKCKVQVSSSDLSVKYEKLENDKSDKVLTTGEKCRKQTKECERKVKKTTDNNTWDSVVLEVSHTEKCKHSKSLSLTTQVSPKSTTTTDGDDLASISTLSSMLENPLLKRANLDNPLFKRADGERPVRPVGPVHPWKLGKDKNQVRLELEETGLLVSTKYEKYAPNIDPKEEGIIGDLRSIGIISNSSSCSGKQTTEPKRKLPPRLTHLSTEVGTSLTNVPGEKSGSKNNVLSLPVTSKSEVGTESSTAVENKAAEPTSGVQENNEEATSKSEEITRQTSEVELKIKIIDTDIL